ncbi:NADH:flavin oxidoreductase [Saccharospirillum sp. MSK14-1]|uniref:NADH:flavin oxidoreductase n=1 Tax=Saccharospirillum sp. MSK14-1 TaxID=1897632 RepID=UPI000D3C3BFF|nr:NADH:flavin oxidoreductase [Saccharospirillum sp. MSK14-1]PTY36064.1 NADH:flavin oxidoreductase [Saccharospirillum sp. MSK14-1]
MTSAADLFTPLTLKRGPAAPNRLVLAPLTNTQSYADGTLAEDEYRWLTLRAEGGFGWVTTCASHVQPSGQGFPGQLGCFSDDHLPGLTRLAEGLREAGALSSLQLHHAGIRAFDGVTDKVGPSAHAETGARAMSEAEVEQLVEDFIRAAQRAEQAGFDGVQIHGGHGYILTQFLSAQYNQRDDRWGGSLDNRARLLFAILDGIRATCRPDFQIGVRISTERFGLELPDMIEVARQLLASDALDYLDLSLWDFTKQPEDSQFAGRTLMSLFTELPRGEIKLGVAGKIMSAADARAALDAGADYVAIGKAGIMAHDFPKRVQADANFASPALPIAAAQLANEGISPTLMTYLRGFPGFIAD